MLDIKLLRENPEEVKRGIAAKQADPKLVDTFLKLDLEWRVLTKNIEEKRAEQKKLSHSIHSGQGSARAIEEGRKNKEEIKALEEKLSVIEKEREAVWRQMPNLPLPSVPRGKTEADNAILREEGKKPEFSFKPKEYTELAEKLGLIDIERAAKVSGSRFAYLLGDLVRMEFALGQFLFETIADPEKLGEIIAKNNLDVKNTPFIPVLPPVMVNHQSMEGMGYMDRGKDEIYHLPQEDLYLIGTSEQAIGPMHQDETFDAERLPLRYVGFSPCFRREAGSYGKDTKGIIRVHQFNKFEMFSFSLPEKSEEEHRFLLAIEEYLMQALALPYHVLNICTADLGDPAAAKYDVEAWLPGQNGGKGEYRETHSTSNTTDFQSRRLNIKYKNKEGSGFAHLLNGTAFSERPLIAIMENYQTEDGKIAIPKVLQKYVGKKVI